MNRLGVAVIPVREDSVVGSRDAVWGAMEPTQAAVTAL